MSDPTRPRHRTRAWALALATLTLGVAGCSQGPDAETMKGEVQARLEATFGPGLFSISTFARDGSYPFTAEDSAEPRLLVYYRARLEFQKDYSLAKWDQVNAGALTSLLGAAPEGITGIVPTGNKAGDQLAVFGSSTYRKDGDAWVPDHRVLAPETAAPEDRDEGTPTEKALAELVALHRELANTNQRVALAALEDEVLRARRDAGLRVDKEVGRLSVVTSSDPGVYGAVARGLEDVADARKVGFQRYSSGGSVENCRLVGDQRAEFAIAQSDVARMAHEGSNLFEGLRPRPGLRAVATLFPEAIHLVARAGGPVRSLADLAGRKVGIGRWGSGTRYNALQVLEAGGLSEAKLGQARDDGLADTLAAFRKGELDAFFVTMSYPAHPIEELASDHPVRLVPLPSEVIDRLSRSHRFFPRMVLPAHTYPGQEDDVPSLGVTATLITHEAVPAERVQAMLDLLFADTSALARRAPVGAFITRDSATLGLSIPLHDAAAKALGVTPTGGTGSGD